MRAPRLLSRSVVVLVVGGGVGCASTPSAFPSTPLPEGQVAEVGTTAGPVVGYRNDDGVVPLDRVGALAHLYGRYSLLDHIDLTGSVHVGGALGLTLSPSGSAAMKAGGHAYSARLGANFRYAVFQSLHLGAGLHVEVQEHAYAALERSAAVLLTVPMSERIWEELWVTVRPTAGLAVPLYVGAPYPFYGVIECPAGLSWRVLPWLSLLVEAGFHVPTNGIYATGGVAASF